MRKATPPTSGADGRAAIDLALPRRWPELTDGQLTYVLRLLAAGYQPGYTASLLLLRLLPAGVSARDIPLMELGAAADSLSWIGEPPREPARPEGIGGGEALDRELHGVPFATWLAVENLWRGCIERGETGQGPKPPPVVASLLDTLWPGYRPESYAPWHGLAALMWVNGLKESFAALFPHLYRPAGRGDGEPDARETMETQIRALTGGDVTKRPAVLETDTWAALTELDAKAREAAELRKYGN